MTKKEGRYYPGVRLTTIPLFASVRAGNPDDAHDEKIDDISLESYLINDPRHTVIIKVRGDSMIDAGIHDGDLLVVDTQKKPRLGDIVVAIVDAEYTVKYLAKDAQGKFVFDPANSEYTRIVPEHDLHIYGLVTGSVRKY